MRSVVYIVTAIICSAVEASADCSAPNAPGCVSRHGSFDDEWAFTRCKREMEDYRSEVEVFIQCNKEQIRRSQEASEGAASEYNNAVNSFNRRVSQ